MGCGVAGQHCPGPTHPPCPGTLSGGHKWSYFLAIGGWGGGEACRLPSPRQPTTEIALQAGPPTANRRQLPANWRQVPAHRGPQARGAIFQPRSTPKCIRDPCGTGRTGHRTSARGFLSSKNPKQEAPTRPSRTRMTAVPQDRHQWRVNQRWLKVNSRQLGLADTSSGLTSVRWGSADIGWVQLTSVGCYVNRHQLGLGWFVSE